MKELSAHHVNEIADMLYEWSPNEKLRLDNGYAFCAMDAYALLRAGADVHRVAIRLVRFRNLELGQPADPKTDQERAQHLVHWWGRQ